MAQGKNIYVYMDWQDSDLPVLMGVLHSEVLRGKEIFSFENNSDWLRYNRFRALDPDLAQFSGKQYLPTDKSNFGLFLDSSPDRWGRMLMRRREAIDARSENRAVRTLTEVDYLLGVYDANRMGALRLKLSPDGEFMDNNKAMATPPWTSIRDLEYASLQLEKEESKDDAEYAKWLKMLIAPGSSLGGARPKANILDNDSMLWIAKFPSGHDTKDMGAWEAVVAELAVQCGIIMSECKVMRFSSHQHTFLTKRFDRIGGKRIHFASAMTLLGYTDGADSAEGVSYLEIAEWIGRNCNNVAQNLEQLWRRIVFNIVVSNCDDHLRNHGFLLTTKGWTLSPAYDINPDERGMGLKLNISEDDNSLDFELALSVAEYFGLDPVKAGSILSQIRTVVSNWRSIATKYGISRSEQDDIAGAFRF
nr:HipA domain-containing protein [uncultured Bacteroides sp.]